MGVRLAYGQLMGILHMRIGEVDALTVRKMKSLLDVAQQFIKSQIPVAK